MVQDGVGWHSCSTGTAGLCDQPGIVQPFESSSYLILSRTPRMSQRLCIAGAWLVHGLCMACA